MDSHSNARVYVGNYDDRRASIGHSEGRFDFGMMVAVAGGAAALTIVVMWLGKGRWPWK